VRPTGRYAGAKELHRFRFLFPERLRDEAGVLQAGVIRPRSWIYVGDRAAKQAVQNSGGVRGSDVAVADVGADQSSGPCDQN